LLVSNTSIMITAFDSTTAQPPAVWYHKVWGAWVVGTFVVVWISSLLSPLLLGVAWYLEQHSVAAAIVAISVVAYLPWQRGVLCDAYRNVTNFGHYRLYKSCRIQYEEPLPIPPPDAQSSPSDGTTASKARIPTFYAVHPHGAFCLGWSCLFCSPYMAHVTFCFAPALYYSPFFRLFARICGRPGSASKPGLVASMKQRQDLAMPPGGFEEATLTDLTQDRVFIQKRTGFVKLCLQHGPYQIRPTYTFGEKQCYWNLQGWWKQRLQLNRYGLPAILVWGQPLLPFLPKTANVDMTVVVGRPLVLPRIEHPTTDDVQLWHGRYMVALQQLFEEHKEDAYGPEAGGKDCKLEVW
jgi:Diacylglycerol acyltransferase